MATGGNDSGVETGNESNDLDDIGIHVIVNEMGDAINHHAHNPHQHQHSHSLPSSSSFDNGFSTGNPRSPGNSADEKDVPPPPPPTSPAICGTGDSEDPFPEDQVNNLSPIGGGGGVGGPEDEQDFISDSLDGMQGDPPPAEDFELEEDNGDDRDDRDAGTEMDESTMDKDYDNHHDHYDQHHQETSSGHDPNHGRQPFAQSAFPCASSSVGGGGFHSSSELSSSPFQNVSCVSPPNNQQTLLNNCRALVKFEFPELPKLVCDFAEPPAGLRSFLGVEPIQSSDGSQRAGGYSVLSPAPSTNDCRSLIPYEQHELHQKVFPREHRRVRNKLYDNWSNLRKEYNERRLRTATSAGNQMMVLRLLENGVDPNSSDELGRSPLHIAACKGFSEIVRLLLRFGANPNQKDSVGNTALHLSACTNHFDVVTDLLRAGTDVSTMDNNGRNPLQLAQSKLKLIMQCSKTDNEDTLRIKKEVQQIIEMMTEYLQKKGQDLEAELLSQFADRLTLSHTQKEVDDLLVNLTQGMTSLSITAAHHQAALGGGGRSRAMTNPVKIPPRNPYLVHHLNPDLARPRSASFSAPSAHSDPSTHHPHPHHSPHSHSQSPLATQSRNFIKPAVLSRLSPTVHEEQQLLMSQCNKD